MKIAIIQERKNPPDKRVVLSPSALKNIQTNYPEIKFIVEPSPVRIFSDEEYKSLGIEVNEAIEDCDIFLGVKEVPVANLIPNKTYFFFSHTIKMQPHNQKLLQAIVKKNITLIDHETLVDKNNKRLIGFGRYAGLVGAYNAFRGFGLKYELFNLPAASKLQTKNDLIEGVKRFFLPPIKIVLTGYGKVGMGAKEILDGAKIKEVSVDDFLNKKFATPVYTHIDVLDYNKRKDNLTSSKEDFYINPEQYVSDFEKYTSVADIFIAGHFYGNNAPEILTLDMLRKATCKIKVVADISCDVNGPVACTIRSSTIEDPFYGFWPSKNCEVPYNHPDAITIMAVDNLPCELPKEASEGFGETFIKNILPAFLNNDKDAILERATIVKEGCLTPKFEYLKDYVNQT